ncbi:MAG: isocitrate lyase/phosphoenolpyruvate mutase family protein [Desulfobulbaceae bacterium]|nr:isocitrate lyase/phosphoenolpyruvate mutase family protein [Desulfobulbaceae bacterium]
MIISQAEKAQKFRKLHVKGEPLMLTNIWDAGSAKTVAGTGAQALGTASWAVAAAHGYEDGENMPFELVLENFKRIVGAVDLPVSFDLEAGYARPAQQVAQNASRALAIGGIGLNLEDQIVGEGALYDAEEQSGRLRAVRDVVKARGDCAFINARCDVFMLSQDKRNMDDLVDEVIARGRMYFEAGADGLFVPGLDHIKSIERICNVLDMPINIMAGIDGASIAQLSRAGVARISVGPGLYQAVSGYMSDVAGAHYQ